MFPTVDVLMLVYNHEKTLKQSIQSVLNQKSVDVNLIITNDASTDKSQKIIDSFNSNKIHCLKRKINKGPAVNAEFLLDSVKSNYVAFLEGDDYWVHDNKLIDQINVLDDNYTFCYTSYSKKYLKNDTSQFYNYDNKVIEGKDLINNVINGFNKNFHINTLLLRSNTLFKIRSKYKSLFFDKKISTGDLRFFCTLINDFKGYYLNHQTLVYNFDQGISSSKLNLKWRFFSAYSKFKISYVILGFNKLTIMRLLKFIYFFLKLPFLKTKYIFIKN